MYRVHCVESMEAVLLQSEDKVAAILSKFSSDSGVEDGAFFEFSLNIPQDLQLYAHVPSIVDCLNLICAHMFTQEAGQCGDGGEQVLPSLGHHHHFCLLPGILYT
jgi:hypothetical protein